MKIDNFLLLMWKNYRLRRYHWFMTILELALPIAVTYLIVKAAGSYAAGESALMNATVNPAYSKHSLLTSFSSSGSLIYTPSNLFTDHLMGNTKKIFGNPSWMRIAYNDTEDQLETFLSNSTEGSWFGVVFYDTENTDRKGPSKLRYAIRNRDKWRTKSLYNEETVDRPTSDDPYHNQGFSGLQLAINEAFIRLKTEKSAEDESELFFEAFPYPEYVSSNSPRSFVSTIVCLIVVVTVLIVSIPLIHDIIEEKDAGVKELMKVTGLDEWLIWISWFVHGIFLAVVSFTVVSVLLKCPIEGPGKEAIYFTDFSVVWLLLMLYVVANVSFCFLFCALFQKATIATSVFVVVFVVIVFALSYVTEKLPNTILNEFSCIFPVGAFIQGFARIRYFEMKGIEFRFSDIAKTDGSPHTVSLLFAIAMLIFDTFLYLLLAVYITAINPGKFGAAKHPLFFLKGLLKPYRSDDAHPLKNLDEKVETEFLEDPPSNLEVSIQIKDLYKNFGSFYAVKGVNLNIYKGEITALLGHNGAGKTTTMSILTGLLSATAGNVYYKNLDVLNNMDIFRGDLGMCPQEDRLLPYLSVMDHLLFFGKLKGLTEIEAKKQGVEYLKTMEMDAKQNSLGKELSGGMKRKLCLAISLMGNPETLILDEPTSGMDVQSRRKIWDLLLNMRGDRTVILTTHYMEEADVLGDRIAIMNHGGIVCHGTPLFLKKAYGTGYELTVTKLRPRVPSMTNLVTSIINNATKELENEEEMVYKLPLTETAAFPELFRNLEGSKDHYGIESMGVACTTMEHVFLKVGGVSIYDAKEQSTTVTDSSYRHAVDNVARGSRLALQQISSLFKKKVLYTRRNKFNLFTRIVLPTLISIFLLRGLNTLDKSPEPALDLKLSTYPDTTTVLCVNNKENPLSPFIKDVVIENHGTVVNCDNPDIEQSLLNSARKNLPFYNKQMVIANEINKTTVKLMYNLIALHALPIAVTTYSNAVLKQQTKTSDVEIAAINHPVAVVQESCQFLENEFVFYMLWFIVLAFYSIDTLMYFNVFVNMERINGFKHIQRMSHVSPFIYWLGTIIFDAVLFWIIIACRMFVFKMFDYFNFLTFGPALGALILALILFAISGLLFVYCISYLSSSKEGSYAFLFILNTVGAIIVTVYYMFNILVAGSPFNTFSWYAVLYYFTRYLIYFLPPLNFSATFIKIIALWTKNALCDYCTPALKNYCHEHHLKMDYLVYESPQNINGILYELQFMVIDIVIFSLLLAFINIGYMNSFFNKLKITIFGSSITTREPEMDSDVLTEKERVQSILEDYDESRDVALVVRDLQKNYISWFRPFTAVADVNFAVRPGECFGLLGVNGAGKSTTFKMLTADVLPTKGDAQIDGVKMSIKKSEYLSMAGYCAQTNCFIEELTGREMLNLIASLRGIRAVDHKKVVDKWISILGLEEYQNQYCGSYSGGNKRKLCTAMSLIGDPRVVFLDEPTSGVDPVSRRKLYDVMGQSKAAGQAVVLTSHSMEECETLCDRLTIMVDGVMKCIGTAQHLKKRYAQGFSALIKLTDVENVEHEIHQVKSDMIHIFSSKYCFLKDEHKGLLYYQIKDTTLLWSYMFERMEELKSRHPIIDDYVLTDTTLEEVFISFARNGTS